MISSRVPIMIVLGLIAGSLVVVLLHVLERTDFDLERTATSLVRCAHGKDTIECVRPVLRQVVKAQADRNILEKIEPKVTALQCHYIGHVLGQELFREYKSVERVLGQCSRVCQNACVHGALGEAFSVALGPSASQDPEHISLEDVRAKGKELCTSGSTCHGVGHALYQFLETFDSALGVCGDIAPTYLAMHCYRGVFMEYADARADRSILSDVGPKRISLDELQDLCVRPSIEESRSCFMYLPKMVEAELRDLRQSIDAITKVKELCLSLQGVDRLACISGIGTYRSYAMFDDPASVRVLCEGFLSSAERLACAGGVSLTAAEHSERTKETVAFCASFGEDAVSEGCFASIFEAYETLGITGDSAAFCGENRQCKAAAIKMRR